MELEEVEKKLGEVADKLERVRVMYDQYFMGVERLEPTTLRREVDRDMWELRKEQIRNTSARYRLQMLSQRYQVLQQYWGRTVRDIENGTYKRDMRRALERFGDAAANTYAGRKWKERVERGLAKKADRDKQLEETRRELGLDAAARSAEPGATAASATAPMAAAPSAAATPPTPPPAPAASGPAAPGAAARPAPGSVQRMPVGAPGLLGGHASPFAAQAAAYRSALPNGGTPQPPSATRMPAAAPSPPAPPPTHPPASNGRVPLGSIGRMPAARPSEATAVSASGDISETRLRQIYAQYVDARRQRNETAAAPSYESLAKSLKESVPKLREKTGGRPIDFEVTVKDGKTILKPVVR